MPTEQEKWTLFAPSLKTSKIALERYQTLYDRHCPECGVIVSNQVIEKSLRCPQQHILDFRRGGLSNDQSSMSAWGRCTYCDNYIACQHKFCICCGRLNDFYDANKNRRLQASILSSDREKRCVEINKLLGPFGVQLGLNSSKKHQITKTPDVAGSSQSSLPLKHRLWSTKSTMKPTVGVKDSGFIVSQLKSHDVATETDSSAIPNSSIEIRVFSNVDMDDSDDEFLSSLNIDNLMEPLDNSVGTSCNSIQHVDESSERPLESILQSNTEISQASSSGTTKSASSHQSGNDESLLSSRKLRPRTSTRLSNKNSLEIFNNNDDLSCSQPLKKKKRNKMSLELCTNNDKNVAESYVDLAASSDEDVSNSHAVGESIPKME